MMLCIILGEVGVIDDVIFRESLCCVVSWMKTNGPKLDPVKGGKLNFEFATNAQLARRKSSFARNHNLIKNSKLETRSWKKSDWTGPNNPMPKHRTYVLRTLFCIYCAATCDSVSRLKLDYHIANKTKTTTSWQTGPVQTVDMLYRYCTYVTSDQNEWGRNPS